MGIKDLYEIIESEAPDVMYYSSFSKLTGYTIAADISIFLHKYIKSAGPIHWIDLFIKLLCLLKKNGTKVVCIFDGPNPPIEKKEEQQERRESVEKARNKLRRVRELVDIITNEFIEKKKKTIDEGLLKEIKNILEPTRGKTNKKLKTNYKDIYDIRSSLNIRIETLERQTTPISADFTEKAIQIITYMGLAYFKADGEAEALCSSLCYYEVVDAVLSEDTDVLAYGAPLLFSKIDLQRETFRVVHLESVLEKMEYTHFEFRDLCILLKCDYNKKKEIKAIVPRDPNKKMPKKIVKPKPKNVGKKGALLLSKEYRTFEQMEDVIVDMEKSTKYKRIREIFTIDKNIKNITLPYNGPLDIKNITKFLKENESLIDIDYIKQCWKPVDVVYE